jgi:hypothetical protein
MLALPCHHIQRANGQATHSQPPVKRCRQCPRGRDSCVRAWLVTGVGYHPRLLDRRAPTAPSARTLACRRPASSTASASKAWVAEFAVFQPVVTVEFEHTAAGLPQRMHGAGRAPAHACLRGRRGRAVGERQAGGASPPPPFRQVSPQARIPRTSAWFPFGFLRPLYIASAFCGRLSEWPAGCEASQAPSGRTGTERVE